MRRSWLQWFLAFGCAASPARQGAPPAPKLTMVGIFDLYPFDNEQVVVSLPAAAVRDALQGVLEPRWTQIGSSRRKQAGE
jgi:hypothetical protein